MTLLNEYWGKGKKKGNFFCADCDMNMTTGPLEQYVMLDDKLWAWICTHGGEKIDVEDHLCKDCIEKRLGRQLTLKDLGRYASAPINDEFKALLKKKTKRPKTLTLEQLRLLLID